jgi:hypothetical protein
VIACTSGPAAFYYQHLTSSDPLWRSILSQYANAGVWTPRYVHLVVLLGIPLVLASFGIRRWTAWTEERRFLVIWTMTSLILIYLPFVFQIKLLCGCQFPIAILAAHAWHERVLPALPRAVARRRATAAVIGLASLTNLYLFAWRFTELRQHAAPYYLHHDEVDALNWLSRNAQPADVVLASGDLGQFVPNYGRARAYLAHWAMTNRFYERRANTERFFSNGAFDGWRKDLLSAEHVTLVLKSTWSGREAAAYDPGQSTEFRLVFTRPTAKIYRFIGRDPAGTSAAPSQ